MARPTTCWCSGSTSPSPIRLRRRSEDYLGLAWRRPWLAGAFTAMLLSLAGIPLTMGFVAKFYVIVAAADVALWPPVMVLVVGSAIGLVYYLRIVATLFSPLNTASVKALAPISVVGGLTLAVLTTLLLGLGVAPQPLMRLLMHGAALAP